MKTINFSAILEAKGLYLLGSKTLANLFTVVEFELHFGGVDVWTAQAEALQYCRTWAKENDWI